MPHHDLLLRGTGHNALVLQAYLSRCGLRTLALDRRSPEVCEVLRAVTTEYGKFGAVLTRTRTKLAEATATLDDAEVRTRAMQRSLRAVESLPNERAQALIPGLQVEPVDDEETA